MSEKVDALVVGAGIAGLTAAERLMAAGRSVRVIEARDRVGGRTEGGTFASGTPIELGGQWVGPTQDEALALIDRLGLETFRVHDEGAGLLFASGGREEAIDDSFGLPGASAQAFRDLVAYIDELASRVDLSSPWTSSEAAALDVMTAAEWLSRECRDDLARDFLHVLLGSIFAAETHEYSALHMLFYLGSGGGLHRMMLTVGGAQEARVKGGTHQISERLAAALLASDPHAISLGEQVLKVLDWDTDGPATVVTGTRSIAADKVILAMPPAMMARIHAEPALPANVHAAQTHMLPGSVLKFQVEYPSPFWRDAGLSGTVLSLDHHVSLVYDNCVPDSDRGILVAFVEGAHARTFDELDETQRSARVLRDLRDFFGEQAETPTEVLQRNWSEEPFTRGCYGGRYGTGLWTTLGPKLAAPCGSLHFAGAETSAVWNGYIDGAIRSGQRVAAEILA